MNIYTLRRNKIMEKLEDNSCVIVFSGVSKMKSADEAYPFDVDRSFYYLTGLEKEGMILMMTKIANQVSERLFILPYDELMAKWVGGRMKKDEASEISKIELVFDAQELNTHFNSIVNRARCSVLNLYLDLWHYEYDQDLTLAHKFAKEALDRYPSLSVKDLYPHLVESRLIKDEYEVACIKQAINITRTGIEAMMQNIRPRQNEMFMEGVFQFALMRSLCNEVAFKTIAASGKRATVLHYSDNNNVMRDGELFLCDLGATYRKYNADISRTFPVNGRFSNRQKELYSLVLQAQKIVEANAKPGVSLRDLNNLVIDFYRENLPKHGLFKDVSEYYFHGVSHHLGLDTHDIDNRLDGTLKKGMVITNEPGLYIEDESIGIRIEDDLLITEDGCDNLAKDIIKEVSDIEALMNS